MARPPPPSSTSSSSSERTSPSTTTSAPIPTRRTLPSQPKFTAAARHADGKRLHRRAALQQSQLPEPNDRKRRRRVQSLPPRSLPGRDRRSGPRLHPEQQAFDDGLMDSFPRNSPGTAGPPPTGVDTRRQPAWSWATTTATPSPRCGTTPSTTP